MKYLNEYGNFNTIPNTAVKKILIGPFNTFIVYLENGNTISTRKLEL